jgi:hypothetical protein
MEKVNVAEKLALFQDHWHPRIIAELNGQELKVVKFVGPFVWHPQRADRRRAGADLMGRAAMRVRVLAVEENALRVGPMEAIDGTPVVDMKPVLSRSADY